MTFNLRCPQRRVLCARYAIMHHVPRIRRTALPQRVSLGEGVGGTVRDVKWADSGCCNDQAQRKHGEDYRKPQSSLAPAWRDSVCDAAQRAIANHNPGK